MADATPPLQPAPPVAATLLMVDDEASVLSALRRLFRAQGYRLLQATSGADGLALLRDNPVDLVISDMRMPEMDGVRFLEAVRCHDPGIVRILLTGYADIGTTIAAINRGEIHRYVAKPWDDPEILLLVRDALQRRALEQAHGQLQALTQSQNEELKALNQHLEDRVAARTAELEQVNAMLGKAYEEVNENFLLAVTVFSGLMEMRQDGIAGHSRRVAALAARVGEQLGLNERARQDLHLGAMLHDVGRIGFPDRMLGKPVSTYAPEEMTRYRRHPIDGETALMPLARLHGVARIVRQHHERPDGKGFPEGLAGDAVCIGARIVAVASDYDDLLHGSLAERRFSAEQAQQALRGGIDSRYDRRVVEATLAVLSAQAADAVDDVDLEVRELKPGMVLAHDLLSTRGAILLAAGYAFNARIIQQVSEFASRESMRLTLKIRRDSLPAASGGTRPGAASLPASLDSCTTETGSP
jgi:response regulator RpfG family c-di-GMP phosphodiesterase